MKRTAKANWKGTGLEGAGTLSTQSGVFAKQPYSTKLRFQNEDGKLGTNPEELIAAAHAGCFTMALSFQLSGAGFTPENLDTEATVTIEKFDTGFKVTGIHLDLVASVPGIEKKQFDELAGIAKKNCPISQALAAVEITMTAKLT